MSNECSENILIGIYFNWHLEKAFLFLNTSNGEPSSDVSGSGLHPRSLELNCNQVKTCCKGSRASFFLLPQSVQREGQQGEIRGFKYYCIQRQYQEQYEQKCPESCLAGNKGTDWRSAEILTRFFHCTLYQLC